MSIPVTKAQFIAKVLRELGYPTIKVNVTEEQLDDRVDDALQVFYRRHFDGSEKQYVAHVMSPSDAATKTVVMDPDVIGVINVFPLQSSSGAGGSLLFNVPYQLVMSEIFGLNGGASDGVSSYIVTRTQMNTLQEFLVGRFPIRYNEKTNILYVDASSEKLTVGSTILIECYKQNTAVDYPDVWSDIWLRKYAVELVRRQWSQNLGKFKDVQLPGGITINAKEMVGQAESTIRELEEELAHSYSPILNDFFG